MRIRYPKRECKGPCCPEGDSHIGSIMLPNEMTLRRGDEVEVPDDLGRALVAEKPWLEEVKSEKSSRKKGKE